MAGVKAEIETAACSFVAEDGDAGLAGEFVAGQLGGEGVGCNEKMSAAQGLVKLAGGEVAGAEQEIVAPLAAVMFDVHESDAGAGGKIEGRHAGSIDVYRQIHEWWTVGLLMCGHAQRGNAILRKAFVAQAVELAFSSDAGQLSFEFGKIKRAAA